MNLALTYDHRLIDGCAACLQPLWFCCCPALLSPLVTAVGGHSCAPSCVPRCRSPCSAQAGPKPRSCASPIDTSILPVPGCRREAVAFLKRIKEIVEDPRRLLLDV